MFIRDSNGYLLNINRIIEIKIAYGEPFCAVKATFNDRDNKPIDRTLYKDKELQYCQEYMNKLIRKLAINVETWEI